jgi:hypothetical protein
MRKRSAGIALIVEELSRFRELLGGRQSLPTCAPDIFDAGGIGRIADLGQAGR